MAEYRTAAGANAPASSYQTWSTPAYSFAAEMEANRQTAAKQVQELAAQSSNPWMYNYGTASATTGTNGATPAAAPARIAYPSEQLQYMKGEAVNYPTYLRNLGEQMAQQAYQKQMNQGLRAGAAGQGYLSAMDALNRARLGYMGQAGQQAFDIAKAQEEAATKLYGLDIGQRGQDINYQTEMARIAAMQNMQNQRSGGMIIGGGAGSTQRSSSQGGSSGGGGGVYKDIYGNVYNNGQFQYQQGSDRAATNLYNTLAQDYSFNISGAPRSGL